LTGNAALEDTAAGADVEPLTLLHSQNNTIIIQQMTTQTVVMKVSATNKRQNDCGSDKRPYSAPDCECITKVSKIYKTDNQSTFYNCQSLLLYKTL